MTMMDERIARRRRIVGEDRAARRLKRMLGLLVVLGLVAFAAWFARSPALSLREISVEGAAVTDPAAVAAATGIALGVPTMDVDTGRLAARLEAEPWVASAEVSVDWPGTLRISVVEHRPAAVVGSGDESILAAVDGTVLERGVTGAGRPVVDIGVPVSRPGERISDRRVLGGLAFLAALPGDLAADVTVEAEGERLWATARGHRVRLGRPTAMEDKARVLAALLDTDLPEGATIVLVAPTRPAIVQPEVEGEPGGPSEGEVSG